MMKKRYISPATNIVQMYELESNVLLKDSFMVGMPKVDPTHNMNEETTYDKETFLIEY